MRALGLALALAVSGSVAAVGCGDDAGGGTNDVVTQLVGPDGATVELVGGGKVTIPPGALNEEISIKVSKLDINSIAALPDNMEPAGKPVAFEPHGQMFLVPVKIEVGYEGDEADNLGVRPMKLPRETSPTSAWTTVFPNEKDVEAKTVGMETTSFSVILAARPRRTSGTVTLPDGAIEMDGGVSGTGAVGGSGGTGGSGGGQDAGVDANGRIDSGLDGGVDAAVVADCVAPASQDTSIAASDAVFSGTDHTLIATGGNLLSVYSNGSTLTAIGTLFSFDATEHFDINGVAVAGYVAAVGTARGGISTTGRVHIGRIDGSTAPTVYDFASYSEYWSAFNPGAPFAFEPYVGVIGMNTTVAVVEERTFGNLVVFSVATGQPLGFLGTSDLNTGPLAGVTSIIIRGTQVIASINRLGGIGVDPLNAIRTFDISDPTQIVQADERIRTGSGPVAMVLDARQNRFFVSSGVGREVSTFTVNSAGTISAETLVGTAPAGTQARAMSVVDGQLLVLATPNFGVQPVDAALTLFRLDADGSVHPAGSVDLPDSPAGDYGNSLSTSLATTYSAGSVLNVVDISSCVQLE